MKNKGLLVILFLSCLLLFSLIYINYFNNKIYFKDVKEYEKIEVFSKYKEKKINVCYGNKFRCKKIDYKVQGMVNTEKLGTYTITYRARKNKIESVINKKVEVVDTTAPQLNISGTFNNVCPNGKPTGTIFEALDNYDGNLTDKIEYKVENNKIIYKVTDSSGNLATKEFDVAIKDEEKPSLVLNGDNTMYLSVGSTYKEPGYAAIDNCDGDITSKVKITGGIDTSKSGSYDLVYSVKDEYGNTNSVKRIVKVFQRNSYTPGASNPKTIYLTFDDGPGPYTARLLDILAKYNVKATFFVAGYNNNYNSLLTREHNEGHTVALHSYTHDYATIYSSVDAYMDDLLKIQNKVKEYTGVESKIIRFPGGASNTVSRKYRMGIMTELTNKVEDLGFRYFDWTISSGDAGNTTDPNKIVQNVINGVESGGENVVLMHDIKSYTVNSVERIIEYGLSNGYTFAPLTMESPVVHQKVNN